MTATTRWLTSHRPPAPRPPRSIAPSPHRRNASLVLLDDAYAEMLIILFNYGVTAAVVVLLVVVVVVVVVAVVVAVAAVQAGGMAGGAGNYNTITITTTTTATTAIWHRRRSPRWARFIIPYSHKRGHKRIGHK